MDFYEHQLSPKINVMHQDEILLEYILTCFPYIILLLLLSFFPSPSPTFSPLIFLNTGEGGLNKKKRENKIALVLIHYKIL